MIIFTIAQVMFQVLQKLYDYKMEIGTDRDTSLGRSLHVAIMIVNLNSIWNYDIGYDQTKRDCKVHVMT
jgi:hypothetical protein